MNPRLLVLCFGNFIIGTGTLIVPGMLPALAQGLGVQVPVAAQLITAFAFTVCITAPPLAALTSRFDRRALLVAVQLIFAGAHIASALVTDYHALLLLRILSSLGAALFTAQAASTAALLVPAEHRGGAIAFVFLGWSIASVAGMPIGAYVGETLGWRAGFALVGAGAFVAAAAVHVSVPRGLYVQPMDRSMWRALFGNRALMLAIAVTAIQSAAQFTVLSFIVPAFREMVAATPALVSALLALLGLAGIAGNVLGARLVDRIGAPRVVLCCLTLMLAAHLLWPFIAGAIPILVICLLLWGLGSFSANSAQQARLVGLSPPHAPVSVAMNSSAIFLGQALGTAVGAFALATNAGADGYARLVWISVPLFVLAIVVSLLADRRSSRPSAKPAI